MIDQTLPPPTPTPTPTPIPQPRPNVGVQVAPTGTAGQLRTTLTARDASGNQESSGGLTVVFGLVPSPMIGFARHATLLF